MLNQSQPPRHWARAHHAKSPWHCAIDVLPPRGVDTNAWPPPRAPIEGPRLACQEPGRVYFRTLGGSRETTQVNGGCCCCCCWLLLLLLVVIWNQKNMLAFFLYMLSFPPMKTTKHVTKIWVQMFLCQCEYSHTTYSIPTAILKCNKKNKTLLYIIICKTSWNINPEVFENIKYIWSTTKIIKHIDNMNSIRNSMDHLHFDAASPLQLHTGTT